MTEVVRHLMTVTEARECVQKINSFLTNPRALILDLYEREGWSALGYESWRACVIAEFKQSERYLYNQLEAARAEKNICAIAQKEIPEGQLRPLTHLPPAQQKEVWQKAVETAPEGKVTAAHVQKVVEEIHRPKRLPDPNVNRCPELMSDKFKSAYDNFLREIKNEKAMDWKTTSIDVALKYIETLKTVILMGKEENRS